MARNNLQPSWERAITLLSGTVVGLVVVVGLQWGRPVLIPIALAGLLTFLLNPLVTVLQRHGIGRFLSVFVAVTSAGILLIALGWMVTLQVSGMLTELPHHAANIKAKVRTLHQLGSGRQIDRIERLIEEVVEELQVSSATEKSDGLEATDDSQDPPKGPVEVVQVRKESIPWLILTGYLGSAFQVLATLGFTMVLLVFFLSERENMRDRVALLAGKTRIALSSKAMEDITERIGAYITMVALVNGGFGVVMTLGLFLLQVPYALLWGAFAALLRFIPYLGPWLGAIFPIVMSFATSDGWWQPIAVIAYVATVELLCGNVVEPFAFGHYIGVSPTALLISAAFWLYLWGPIGVVLSAPIAAGLVVLGKTIPQLNFLALLLGDGPVLRANVGFYQRLMMGDDREASRQISQRIEELSLDAVYDEMLIPALNYTRRDLRRRYLKVDDQHTVLETMRRALDQALENQTPSADSALELSDTLSTGSAKPNGADPTPAKILGCAATDETDGLALELLGQMLDETHWALSIENFDKLPSEMANRVAEEPPDAICLAALRPGGLAQARYLCKRLRAAGPDVPIVVGRWGQQPLSKVDRERLEHAGATFVTTTLLDTRKLLILAAARSKHAATRPA